MKEILSELLSISLPFTVAFFILSACCKVANAIINYIKIK